MNEILNYHLGKKAAVTLQAPQLMQLLHTFARYSQLHVWQ